MKIGEVFVDSRGGFDVFKRLVEAARLLRLRARAIDRVPGHERLRGQPRLVQRSQRWKILQVRPDGDEDRATASTANRVADSAQIRGEMLKHRSAPRVVRGASVPAEILHVLAA